MKRYEMIGSTEEDVKMNQIIKNNKIKTRMLNEKRAKKERFENKLARIAIFGVGLLVSFGVVGMMFLVALIENM